jgi:hypothetical protein
MRVLLVAISNWRLAVGKERRRFKGVSDHDATLGSKPKASQLDETAKEVKWWF